MPVKIENMDMPKCCLDCRGLFGFVCVLKKQEPTPIKNKHLIKKPIWCPLKECK